MRKLKLREGTNTAVLFGHHDQHLKLIEEDLGVRLSARGEELTLDGTADATRHAERVLTELATLANDGMVLQPDDITHALSALRQSPETPIKELLSNAATIVTKKRFVAPKTPTQKAYIEAIETHDIVIGIGPAGTGKTYLAMAMAVSAGVGTDMVEIPSRVRQLEDLGYDFVGVGETSHNPFLPLVLIAEHTERMRFGTSVAIAFPRVPHITANIAWDLSRYSGGRFVLGLGTQVKGHNERRFSVLGGDAEAIASRLNESYTDTLTLATAVTAGTAALQGADRALGADDLEVAMLARSNGRRCFKRLTDDEVAQILAG